MIRHTPSFIISIIIHLLLLVVFFYAYRYISSLSSKKDEEKVCLKLACIIEDHKEHIKEKEKPKKIVPPKPKPKPKPKVKPKVKKPKKEIIKKIIPKPLTVPVVKEIVKPKEEPEEIYIEPVKKEMVEEEVVEEVFPVEPQEDKVISQEQEYMDEHIKKIVRLLSDNLYYPRSARKRGIVGEVIVKFCLSKDATVSKIEIISSKSEILSRAAKKTIEELSGEFPKPSQELILSVPIKYELKR